MVQFLMQNSMTEKIIKRRKDSISYSHEEYSFTFFEGHKIT
jgi:hypothetical protein